MKELAFFKGLFIGGVFSILFWVGAAYAITNITSDEMPAKEIITPEIEKEPVALL